MQYPAWRTQVAFRTGRSRSPSEKSCSRQSETVGADLVRSELTFE